MANRNLIEGTLPSATPVVRNASNLDLPATVTLTSADGTRKIELSTDGANFYQPTYDASPTGAIVVSVRSPIKCIRFTGVQNDTWSIR